MLFHINRLLAASMCGLALVWVFVGSVAAAPVEIAPDQSCVSSGCHEDFGKGKYVHSAMEDDECESCHEQKGKEHAFEYPAKDNDLCYECHDTHDKKNQHPALEDGCVTCHNPHQSDTKFMLEADSMEELCFACHDEELTALKWAHAPAEAGECASCHNPHESDNSSLLVKSSPDVCYQCHTDKEEDMADSASVHAAADDDCLTCHNPHSADREHFVKDAMPQLCFECHDDVKELLTSATTKHGIIEQGKRCLNCHNPHASKHDTLLIESAATICLSCHNTEIETENGELSNIKWLVDENEYPHGPVADGDCVACHDPHASNNFRILKQKFPRRYYASFTFRAFALCFECHDKDLMLNEITEELTSFRDGSRNLHFLHVNREEKGRKCTNCHEVHSSIGPKHIKEFSMFGTWEMELMFEATETGGSCDPGCHKYRAYDRMTPVEEDWRKPDTEEYHMR